MEKSIEEELGSWDLEVGSFSYLVVYLKREESTDFWRQSFIYSEFRALIFGFVVQLYMIVTPVVLLLYISFDYLTKINKYEKKIDNSSKKTLLRS